MLLFCPLDLLACLAGISGGQAKRLSIATEYLALPGIFCLDEPTTGLDSFTSLQIGALLLV